MEFLKFIFAFIFFHRRYMYGLVLLVALVYFLLEGRHLIPQMGNQKTPINVDPSVEAASSSGLAGSGTGHSETELLVSPELDESSSALAATPESEDGQPDSQPKTATSGTVAALLESGTLQELIEESLKIRNDWKRDSAATQYLRLTNRKKISQRMLEMELNDHQRAFAQHSLIETLSVRDSINVSNELNLGSRDELMTVVQQYLGSSDTSISSYANLALVFALAADFRKNPSLEQLQVLESAIDESFQEISEVASNKRKLAEVVADVGFIKTIPEEDGAFLKRMLPRFKDDTSDFGKTTYLQLCQKCVFGPLNLESLVDRMGEHESELTPEIATLFENLAAHPDVSLAIYQVSLDVIRELIRQERKSHAKELIDQLDQQIIPKLSNDNQRKVILAALNELKRFQ